MIFEELEKRGETVCHVFLRLLDGSRYSVIKIAFSMPCKTKNYDAAVLYNVNQQQPQGRLSMQP
jgi:hypothetical protein